MHLDSRTIATATESEDLLQINKHNVKVIEESSTSTNVLKVKLLILWKPRKSGKKQY